MIAELRNTALVRLHRSLLWKIPRKEEGEIIVRYHNTLAQAEQNAAGDTPALAKEIHRERWHEPGIRRFYWASIGLGLLMALALIWFARLYWVDGMGPGGLVLWSCFAGVALPGLLWFCTDRGMFAKPMFAVQGEKRRVLLCQAALLLLAAGAQWAGVAGFQWLVSVKWGAAGPWILAIVQLLAVCTVIVLALGLYHYLVDGSAYMLGIVAQAFGLLFGLFMFYRLLHALSSFSMPGLLLYPYYTALTLSLVYFGVVCLRRKRHP